MKSCGKWQCEPRDDCILLPLDVGISMYLAKGKVRRGRLGCGDYDGDGPSFCGMRAKRKRGEVGANLSQLNDVDLPVEDGFCKRNWDYA